MLVNADLHCSFGEKPVSIRGENNHLKVEVPDVATAIRLARVASPRGFFSQQHRKLLSLLARMGVLVEFQVRGRTIAAAGHLAEGHLRLPGVPDNFVVHPLSIARAILSKG